MRFLFSSKQSASLEAKHRANIWLEEPYMSTLSSFKQLISEKEESKGAEGRHASLEFVITFCSFYRICLHRGAQIKLTNVRSGQVGEDGVSKMRKSFP